MLLLRLNRLNYKVNKMIKAKFDTRELALAIQEAPVTVVKTRKAPKIIMGAKKTKTFQAGTSGASMGYPKSDLLSKFTGHKCIGHF
jgi:hypothetical protein